MARRRDDELGAHVSAAGGLRHAPERARQVGAAVLQLFTKQPSRWAEPVLSREEAAAFRQERQRHRIAVAGAHDAYLINLASPEADLWRRSLACFSGELERGRALGLDFVVTHPGNATDGDLASGVARNAEGIAAALERVPGSPRVLVEITAGAGFALGGTFASLAAILARIPADLRHRVGVCFDTCHAWVAGYDLVGDWEAVWRAFDGEVGCHRIGLFHLNDAKAACGSRLDRHESIGDGALGPGPFRRLLTEERFAAVPKVLETPKGDEPVRFDRRNLRRLRRYRRQATDLRVG